MNAVVMGWRLRYNTYTAITATVTYLLTFGTEIHIESETIFSDINDLQSPGDNFSLMGGREENCEQKIREN